jgi:hypothetical protein
MTDTPSPLSDLDFMDAFLDVAIPPSPDGRLPGAGSLGISGEVAGKLAADPVLARLVQAGLTAVYDAGRARHPAGLAALGADERIETVEAQAGAHPMLMIGVVVHLYQAYYRHPRVLEGLGEPARPPFPEGYPLEDTERGLMDKLRARAAPPPAAS